MAADRRSRYYELPPFLDGDRLAIPQRLIDRSDLAGPFVMHRLTDTETLDQLALRYYGRDDLWWRIADANPGRFPADWQTGDLVRVPIGPRVTRVPPGDS